MTTISRTTSASFTFFFFDDTATTAIYTLSLHDALPISTWSSMRGAPGWSSSAWPGRTCCSFFNASLGGRSEEHTSELQSHVNLVCRLLLEKKNTIVLVNVLIINSKSMQVANTPPPNPTT